MTWFIFYKENGALCSSGSSVAPADVLDLQGMAAVEVADAEVPPDWTWDPVARIPVAKVPEAEPLLLHADELIGRFTPQEWAAGKASQHAGIVWFMDQITAAAGRQIDVRSARVAGGLALAVAEGILTTERAAEIAA